MKRGLMGPWISPTSSQLHVGWPWRYAGCQRSMDWEGKSSSRTERVKAEKREESRIEEAESVGRLEKDSRGGREAVTLGAREEGERVEVTADCDSAGRRRGGRQGSKRDREGNEVVIRHMQRGNSGVRGGAVSHEYQI